MCPQVREVPVYGAWVREHMTDQEGLEEIVLLFEEDGSAIDSEMLFSEFETLISGSSKGETANLVQFAASLVKAVYALVGASLTVRAMVFFQFQVDENGNVDTAFNLPLKYLIEQAGQEKGRIPGRGDSRGGRKGHVPAGERPGVQESLGGWNFDHRQCLQRMGVLEYRDHRRGRNRLTPALFTATVNRRAPQHGLPVALYLLTTKSFTTRGGLK